MPRVFLRAVDAMDADLIAQWFNDSENIKLMSTLVRCKSHSYESIEKEIRCSDPNRERFFMVCLEGIGRPIGHAGIDDMDLDDRRGEIFFLIGELEFKGKGYGTQIIHLLLDKAFRELNLNSVFATTTVDNIPTIRSLEKNGFKRIGIRREYNFIGGKFVDEVFMDILAIEFLAKDRK